MGESFDPYPNTNLVLYLYNKVIEKTDNLLFQLVQLTEAHCFNALNAVKYEEDVTLFHFIHPPTSTSNVFSTY